MNKPLKVFITYSHKNTKAKDQLITRLRPLKREGIIDIWHDNEILPGDKWRDAIFNNLADSDLLLYLVSANSLESKNCNKELAAALTAEKKVIPIILEHCNWKNHKLENPQDLSAEGLYLNESESQILGEIQVLPARGKPLNEWNPRSKGWESVLEGIREVIDKMQSKKAPSSETSEKELRAESMFQHGNFLMMLGQLDMAIEIYSQAIDHSPRVASFYNNRGVAYDEINKNNYAIKDYNTAIQLKPDYADAYYNRGLTYDLKGEIDLAIKDYNTAIQLKPDYPNSYYNRGVAYGNKGETDLAIKDYNTAIQLKPDYVSAYNNRGVLHRNKGEINCAIKDYNIAIQLKSDYTDAYYNRGIAYDKKGDVDQAIKNFTRAIELNSNYTGAYLNLGTVYDKKGEVDSAIENYKKAIELDPNYFEAYLNLGVAYDSKGEVDSAIENYNTAIQLKTDDPRIYNNRGVAYLHKGAVKQSIENYDKAIELDPNYALVYHNRGEAYSEKGEFNLAIKDYNTAIGLNLQLALVYYNRGETWLHLREWEKAKVDLTTAKDKGLDIIASFRNHYRNVEAYEQRHHVKLPEDIALLLTQRRRTRFRKTRRVLDADGNLLESPIVVNLREQLRKIGRPLGEYIKAKPSFGINTVPTEVFVVDEATRDELIEVHPASVDILKPFLHGQDLRRWHVDTPHQWLIFTHRGIAINDYPAILQHLEKYRESLSKRKGKQEWYELPASLGNPERFAQPKLVCPDTYNHQTFAVDTAGYYYGNTSYLIPTEETWLCGLLNSRTVEWFYSQVSNQLTIDPLRARSGYIQQIPIPDLTSIQKALIAKIVDYLIYLQQQPTINSKDLAHARDHIMLGYFERIIDGLVYEVYLPEDLHKGDKHFFQPLLEEQLPSYEEIQADKMAVLRDIFELLYERTHLVRRNLYYLDSVKAVRIIEGKI